MRYRQLSFVFLALLLAACGGQLATDGGVNGTWTGQITEGRLPLSLVLAQTGTTVTGQLTVERADPIPLTGNALNNPDDSRIVISLSGGGTTNSVQIEASSEGSAMSGSMVLIEGETKTPLRFTATR